MLISGKRGTDFNDSIKEITAMCRVMNIKLSAVSVVLLTCFKHGKQEKISVPQ